MKQINGSHSQGVYVHTNIPRYEKKVKAQNLRPFFPLTQIKDSHYFSALESDEQVKTQSISKKPTMKPISMH